MGEPGGTPTRRGGRRPQQALIPAQASMLVDSESLVVLVDEQDREVGTAEKIQAHSGGGRLHRAVSVLVFNGKGELLIQRRADGKYHSAGLWSNTCCTHPAPGESVEAAARRRLKEEMGFETELREAFQFTYRADVGNGLTEWEFDHVFVGLYDGEVKPNPSEVSEYKWVSLENLLEDVKRSPEKYTKWFVILLEKHAEKIRGALAELLKTRGR